MPANGLPVAAGKTVRYSSHCTISFQNETRTCVKHMVFPWEFWIKISFFFLLFFYSREFSDTPASISLFHPWQHKGGEANRVGDIRLHFQGVERIVLPQFPHLRRTEARNQCDQCCLSEPLIPSIRHTSSPPLALYSSSHLYNLKHSRALFFFFLTQDVIPRRPCCDAPRAFSDIQHVSDVLFAHR